MLKHQLKTDRHGVNVWPYASAMLDESSQDKSIQMRDASPLRRPNTKTGVKALLYKRSMRYSPLKADYIAAFKPRTRTQ